MVAIFLVELPLRRGRRNMFCELYASKFLGQFDARHTHPAICGQKCAALCPRVCGGSELMGSGNYAAAERVSWCRPVIGRRPSKPPATVKQAADRRQSCSAKQRTGRVAARQWTLAGNAGAAGARTLMIRAWPPAFLSLAPPESAIGKGAGGREQYLL